MHQYIYTAAGLKIFVSQKGHNSLVQLNQNKHVQNIFSRPAWTHECRWFVHLLHCSFKIFITNLQLLGWKMLVTLVRTFVALFVQDLHHGPSVARMENVSVVSLYVCFTSSPLIYVELSCHAFNLCLHLCSISIVLVLVDLALLKNCM